MERLQRSTTKFIHDLKVLPYEARLKDLQLLRLYYHRARSDMIEDYKYMCNKYNIDTSSLIARDQDSHTREHPCKLKKVICRTEQYIQNQNQTVMRPVCSMLLLLWSPLKSSTSLNKQQVTQN